MADEDVLEILLAVGPCREIVTELVSQLMNGGLEAPEAAKLIRTQDLEGAGLAHLPGEVSEETVVPGDHHLRGPESRLDVQVVELGGSSPGFRLTSPM